MSGANCKFRFCSYSCAAAVWIAREAERRSRYPPAPDEATGLPVGGIDMRTVLRVLQLIWSKKTETASRVRSRIDSVIDYARSIGAFTAQIPRAGKSFAQLHGGTKGSITPNGGQAQNRYGHAG